MKDYYCEHCGAKINKYWHKLNDPLCRALIKMYRLDEPVNITEIGLSHNQVCNFAKLKYWKFVESVSHGIWTITDSGRQFCEGLIQVPERVQTFRGSVCSTDDKLVRIGDVVDGTWLKAQDYILSAEPAIIRKDGQSVLFIDK